MTDLEKFGVIVFHSLVENYDQTFFVGGMVRDILLQRKITDVDIATVATPQQVERVLRKWKIQFDNSHARYGIMVAKRGTIRVEIATFRQDLLASSRYPEVRFVKTPKADSSRRDFTINALYYNPKTFQLLDFHQGLADLKLQQLKFVGGPKKKIHQDPLRIVRALRFELQLKFNLEHKTKLAIKQNSFLLNKLSMSRISKEILKLPTQKQRTELKKIINRLSLDTK